YHDPGLGREDQGTAGGALERAVNPSASTLPLTTVRAPFYELGWRAVEVLLAQLGGERVSDVEVRPAELVVRRSCACLAPLPDTADPATQQRGDAADALDQLSAAFLAELAGQPGDPFLRLLDEHLRGNIRGQQRLEGWWEVLREVRQRTSDAGRENP